MKILLLALVACTTLATSAHAAVVVVGPGSAPDATHIWLPSLSGYDPGIGWPPGFPRTVDLDADGQPEFAFGSSYIALSEGAEVLTLLDTNASMRALGTGDIVGPVAPDGSQWTSGNARPFGNVPLGYHYMAISFLTEAGRHYGWLRFIVTQTLGAGAPIFARPEPVYLLQGFAYESEPEVPIEVTSAGMPIIPEPSALGLASLGGLILLMTRRRGR